MRTAADSTPRAWRNRCRWAPRSEVYVCRRKPVASYLLGVLTDGQAQCASQEDAPSDGEMPDGRIGLTPPHARFESCHERGGALVVGIS